MRTALLEQVIEAFWCRAVANIKGTQIKAILHQVHEKLGKLGLYHSEAERESIEFNCVGPKAAPCMLLICLHHDSFAVDTFVVCSIRSG